MDELRKINAYWRASLYLCLGMLYLKGNPLLREPLKIEDTKRNATFISGPGHGDLPALLILVSGQSCDGGTARRGQRPV